jgi:SAM-dependent methyltransferase
MATRPDQAPSDQNIDAVFYRDGASNSFAMNLLKTARLNMFNLFIEQMRPSADTTVLDIGVSDDENEGANFLEKSYPWPDKITCAGIGSGEQVKARYPSATFRQIAPNEPLPFADKSFDIATSNAVLEHVGGVEQRRQFILEHLRVARSVFITVPNRWFPVEHHTGLPLLHYWPAAFRLLLGKSSLQYWTKPENVDFLGSGLIGREWPGPRPPRIRMAGIKLGPFSSNIAVVASDDMHP